MRSGDGTPPARRSAEVPTLEQDGAAVVTAAIAANRSAFDQLVARVSVLGRRSPGSAAALAQSAAEFAWFNHTGWYSSPTLEAEVARLGMRGLPPVRTGTFPGPHTLHVATQLYSTGGSTQALASWTDELGHRAHHIVLTRQGTSAVPGKITSRLDSRVRLTRLDTRPGSLAHRAARLRSLARSADLVLVHAHPYDVVPAMAFADRDDLPPVVYVDHADHVFWLGITAVDHVMHMRLSGQQLALERRGLSVHHSIVRNRPLAFRGRSMTRPVAKDRWGVAADQTLMVSAADAFKFQNESGPGLAELVEPVLAANPGLHWRIAGPRPETEQWAALSRRTRGRAQAVGRLTDMSVLHQAADLYLDSFPFASLTSLLESGSLANPVVTFRGHPETCAVFGSDSPGIDDLMFKPSSAAELHAVLTTLVREPTVRAERGRATADAIVDSHTGPAWVASMESLYALPRQVDSTGRPPVHAVTQVDRMTATVQATTGYGRSTDQVVAAHLGTMSPPRRMREWRRLRGAAGARALAPDWALAAIRSRR